MIQDNLIKISSKDKNTTIRLSEKTKKMLEALAVGKETHEQILLRLIRNVNQWSNESGTSIAQRDNITGTKYQRQNKTFTLEYINNKYSVVCTYNNLDVFASLRQNTFQKIIIAGKNEMLDWEVDLQIVNLRKNNEGWENPDLFRRNYNKDYLLMYFACLKNILEETFGLNIYEILNEEDYLSYEKWSKIYNKYSLSRDSLSNDVRKYLR